LPRQKISVEKLEYLRKYPPPDENELWTWFPSFDIEI
jgi:hypothetical protein